MKCLYCDSEIKPTLYSVFLKDEIICYKCNNHLNLNRKIIFLDDIKVETFYDYDSLFKDIILQYKECYDEALKKIFIYKIEEYLRIKYHGYKILYVPSSSEKLKNRGFKHLNAIFETLNLEEVKGLKTKAELIQEGKNYSERKMMETNFVYEGERQNKVLIVDDVITTGSSIKGVYSAIKPFCKKISVLVLARR